MLLVAGLMAISTLSVVLFVSTRESREHLESVQKYIEEGIVSKGRILAENQAQALKGLVLDNAFLDIQGVIGRAVHADDDVVYGTYVSTEHEALAVSLHSEKSDRAPEKDAWRQLGLTEDELVSASPKVEHRARLGQDLIEVSYPVTGDAGELVGTIHYGLSTKRMRDALTVARTQAKARLIHSCAMLASFVLAAALLGVLVSRAQAARISRPLEALSVAAGEIAQGRRSLKVDIHSGDELETLGASFNRMVQDLDTSYQQLEELNQTLERKVLDRTFELGQKNRDMRLVLDNVDQGFVTLALDGTMARECSRVVPQWFGDYGEQTKLTEYLAKCSPVFAEHFAFGWDQVIEGIMPLEVSLAQLPTQLETADRQFELRYTPVSSGEAVEGILLTITEVTAARARMREEAEQGELMAMFQRLMNDRRGFEEFWGEATRSVQELVARKFSGDLASEKHVLHTLKGNASLVGLQVVARLCHELEDEQDNPGGTTDAALARLNQRWQQLASHLATFEGKHAEPVIEVPVREYRLLLDQLAVDATNGALFRQVSSWQLEPAARAFSRLAEQARALARSCGKGELEIEIDAGDVRLDPATYAPFFRELAHVIRNAVDHGFESVEERRLSGKPAAPKLRFSVAAVAGQLVFEISDDGRGIDWQHVARLAEQRGLKADSHEDLVRALCADGLSTRDRASEVSGRGIGMAALRRQVANMNGQLDAQSSRGRGTTWRIRFAEKAELASTAPRARRVRAIPA